MSVGAAPEATTAGDLVVSVVVPVYGGERTLEALATGLREALEECGWRHEVIFVCDSPVDDSWSVVRRLADRQPEIRGYLLRRNFGQHPATLLGIRAAHGHTIVTMDEDLEHDPRDVPRLVEESQRHQAIVYGVTRRQHHGLFRNTSSRLVKWFLRRYLRVRDARNLSAFRAFPADVRDAFVHYRGEKVAIEVLLSWAGAPIRPLECQYRARQSGGSGYTLRKLIAHLGNLAFGFSVAPLRAVSYVGLLSVLVAMLIGAYTIVNWLVVGSAVPGFAFLALTICALGGVQLLALGLIGEYLGRLYLDGLSRPQYLISDQVGSANAQEREGGQRHRPPPGIPEQEAVTR